MEVKASWFGFELNHVQSILLLVLAFIGLLNIPFGLLEGILRLMDAIVLFIPAHLAQPAVFTIYELIDAFKNSIITILVFLSFFILCLYTIRRILGNFRISIFKHVSSQEHAVRWLGFKLNHSQSIFLFLLSVIGIISTTASLFQGIDYYPSSVFFYQFFPSFDRNAQRGLFIGLHLLILTLAIYTFLKLKINLKISSQNLEMYYPTAFLIIFITSLVLVIFMTFKLISISYFSMNMEELIVTLLLLLASSNIASFIYLRKIKSRKEKPISKRDQVHDKILKGKLSRRVLIRFLITIFVFIVIFTLLFVKYMGTFTFVNNYLLSILLNLRPFIENSFIFLMYSFFFLFLLSTPFLVLFYYFIGIKRLESGLKELEQEIHKRWISLPVKIKSHSIVIYWISLTQAVYLIVYLYFSYPYLIYDIGYVAFKKSLLFFISVFIFIFCIYNLIKFYSVQKMDRPNSKLL